MNLPQLNIPQKIVLCLGLLCVGFIGMDGHLSALIGGLLIVFVLTYITGVVSKFIIKHPKFTLYFTGTIVIIGGLIGAFYYFNHTTQQEKNPFDDIIPDKGKTLQQEKNPFDDIIPDKGKTLQQEKNPFDDIIPDKGKTLTPEETEEIAKEIRRKRIEEAVKELKEENKPPDTEKGK
ncbi:MAG: hypothetical protein V1871_09630 [Planctomycetota bacterium]